MDLIERFKNQSTIMKILDIAFVVAFIYEVITFNGTNLCIIILGLIVMAEFFQWFIKKEED